MIDKTIKVHNEKIYSNLTKFLEDSTEKLQSAASKICEEKVNQLGLASSI